MSQDHKYGHQYFDKPRSDKDDDQEAEEDMFDVRSCETSCCDADCECDDCLRCSNRGLLPDDEEQDDYAAA